MDTQRSGGRADEPGSANGRESSAGERRRQDAEGTRTSRPYGFLLVLAAIVVIAVVYSVTMLAIGDDIRTPTTAIAAMAAVFPVISALVGTYFGVKAGLDGQDKAREMLDRAINSDERRRDRPRKEDW